MREEGNSRGKQSSRSSAPNKRAARAAKFEKLNQKSDSGSEKRPFKKWVDKDKKDGGPDHADSHKREFKPYKKSDGPYREKRRRDESSKPAGRFDKQTKKYEDKRGVEVSFNDFLNEKRKTNSKDVLSLEKSKQELQNEKNRKPSEDGSIVRLNRFIANAGICSRRDADSLIATGRVRVNGRVVTEMGVKVTPADVIECDGKILQSEKKIYILVNKPKDFITTVEDPDNRRTVMNLIKHAGDERLYPVGRLDRNTTGVLLMTNDGELTKRLTHPKHNVTKIYEVALDKPVNKPDMEKISQGVDLEDGFIKVDEIQYVDPEDKSIIGVQLHSGRNRIVRRIFESLGYKVLRLDRVSFAGLTKKNVPRGEWRHLTDKEVGFLKML